MEINSKYLGIICITLAQVFFTTQDMAIKFSKWRLCFASDHID